MKSNYDLKTRILFMNLRYLVRKINNVSRQIEQNDEVSSALHIFKIVISIFSYFNVLMELLKYYLLILYYYIRVSIKIFLHLID